ncbi:MAG: symporter-like protein [Hyphomicrobiales bacterium]|nr:symporter-like protein [Hyphomicrobiales bacterium]
MRGDDDRRLERAALDGRIAFVMAGIAIAGALVALLDRIGAPERLVAALGPAMTLIGLCIGGVMLRTMRISRFYAGGRDIPPPYAGLATAAIAAGIALPFAPPTGDMTSGAGVFAGLAGGLAAAALVSGPYLRKTGAFSAPDLIAARFPGAPLRLAVAALAALCAAMTALAGLEMASFGLSTIAGIGRPAAAILLAATLLLFAAPGGLSATVWGAAAAGGLFAAAYALPVLLLWARGEPPALPVFGDEQAWTAAMQRIAAWQGPHSQSANLWLSAAMAFGMGCLGPLIAPLTTARNETSALASGAVALVWGTILAAVVAATIAGSATLLSEGATGRAPGRLPDTIYAASATGLVSICGASAGTAAKAEAACRATIPPPGLIRASDIHTRGGFLLTALPPLAGLGAAQAGFVFAGAIALGLALAAAGFMSFAAALGNDAFYRLRDQTALTSRRLAITRALLAGGVVFGAALVGMREFDPRVLIGLAIALAAAGIAPCLALTAWRRAGAIQAQIAFVAGLVAAFAVFAFVPNTIENLAFAAVCGAAAGLAAGIGAGYLLPNRDAQAADDFVSALMRPGETLSPDKGA